MRNMRKILSAFVFSSGFMSFFGMHVVADNRHAYGLAQLQGKRPTMEDAHCVEMRKNHAFFGLFDGHGGRCVADYVAQNLYSNIIKQAQHAHDLSAALRGGYQNTDKNLEQALGAPVAQQQGTTAVSLMIRDGMLYVANAGDSRAVLCRAGKAVALSHDHKPNRPDEKNRIKKLGGRILWLGCWRVQGVLAISRAIGDHELAPYVIPDPEVCCETITNDDEFVILACDGVWDVLTNQEAIDLVRNFLKHEHNFAHAAQKLVQTAFKRGSTDNISAIVVDVHEAFGR